MAVKQVAKGWQVDASYRGKRAPRIVVPDRDTAERLEAIWKADLMAGREPTPYVAKDDKQFRQRYDCTTLRGLLDYTYHQRWKGKKAAESLTRSARLMVEELGYETRVDSLTYETIGEACFRLEAKGNKASTINRKLAGLSVMLGYAVKLGVIEQAPELEYGEEYEGRIRYFSDEEEASLMEYFSNDADMRDMLMIGLDLGYRQGEILGLQVRDYVPTTNKLHLWETKGDTSGGRANQCSDRVRLALARRIKDSRGPAELLFPPISRKEISRRMNAWKSWRGLPESDPACFHVTRHTCCTRLVMSGVPLPVVQLWMGHSDIKTTMRYIHFAPNHLDIAFEAIAKQKWRLDLPAVTSEAKESDNDKVACHFGTLSV